MPCDCKNPPCMCKKEERETTCSHLIRGSRNEERGIFKGWKMNDCMKEGTLREDCNLFWEGKLVLCDEHYDEHFRRANRACGICGSKMRDCVC